jgi:hypothetical protein
LKKKLARLFAALILAFSFAAVNAPSTFAATCGGYPYMVLWENDQGSIDGPGDHKLLCWGTNISNLATLTTADGGWHSGCAGAYWPITYNHWNNCASSVSIFGASVSGMKFCFYDGTSYTGSKWELWYSVDDLRDIGAWDKWSSLKSINGGSC